MILFYIILSNFYTEEFLELGMGARALGIGNAFVGLADDITAFYWNPAGLVNTKKITAFFMYSDNFDGFVKNNTIALAYPLKNYIVCGAINLITAPDIIITEPRIDTVNVSDYIGTISLSRTFNNFCFGLSNKIIFRNFFVEKAYGLLVDVGFLYKSKHINWGVNFSNLIGTPFYWTKGIKDKISPLLKYGLAVSGSVASGKLTICMSMRTTFYKKVSQIPSLNSDLHYGAEYLYKDTYAFRIGDDMGSFVCGFGFIYNKINVDFALKLDKELGAIKRLSSSIWF